MSGREVPVRRSGVQGARRKIKRIKLLGKTFAPQFGSGHLSLRYSARLALLRAYAQEARNKNRSTPACVDPVYLEHDERAAVWKYVASQTHIARESLFWQCLSPVLQMAVCGDNVQLWRVQSNARDGAPSAAAQARQQGCYILLQGTVDVSQEALVDEATIVDDNAADVAIVRPVALGGDVRAAGHVVGSIGVLPESVRVELNANRREARLLHSQMARELRRARRCGVLDDLYPRQLALPAYLEEEADDLLFAREALSEDLEDDAEDSLLDEHETTKTFMTQECDEEQLTEEERLAVRGLLSRVGLLHSWGELGNLEELLAELGRTPLRPLLTKEISSYLIANVEQHDLKAALDFSVVERGVLDWARLRLRERLPPYVFQQEAEISDAPAPAASLSEEEGEPPGDWTWDSAFEARFSAKAEYLSFKEAGPDLWERAAREAEGSSPEAEDDEASKTNMKPGARGELTTREVLALRARGLGFMAPHARARELEAGFVICEEGALATEVLLTVRGDVLIESRRDLDEEDDAGVGAAIKEGLFHDTVELATLTAPVLIGDLPVFGNKTHPMKVTALGGSASVRVLSMNAELFGKLLSKREEECRALQASALIRLRWLDEKKRAGCARRVQRMRNLRMRRQAEEELSRIVKKKKSSTASLTLLQTTKEEEEEPQQQPTRRRRRGGRSWSLWSAGAVMAFENEEEHNGFPASFYAGACMTAFEMGLHGPSILRAPYDEVEEEDAASKARKTRMNVAMEVAGSLGSFAAPALFDHMPLTQQTPPTEPAEPAEINIDIDPKRKLDPPSEELLRAVSRIPFMEPFATMTEQRQLHASSLPKLRHVVWPRDSADDSIPPTDPVRLFDLARIARKRRQADVPHGALRDPSAMAMYKRQDQLEALRGTRPLHKEAGRRLHPGTLTDLLAAGSLASTPLSAPTQIPLLNNSTHITAREQDDIDNLISTDIVFLSSLRPNDYVEPVLEPTSEATRRSRSAERGRRKVLLESPSPTIRSRPKKHDDDSTASTDGSPVRPGPRDAKLDLDLEITHLQNPAPSPHHPPPDAPPEQKNKGEQPGANEEEEACITVSRLSIKNHRPERSRPSP